MPCYKCANGKYKYGERGNCQFDTLEACRAAEAAIHAREDEKGKKPYDRERREEPKAPKKPKK